MTFPLSLTFYFQYFLVWKIRIRNFLKVILNLVHFIWKFHINKNILQFTSQVGWTNCSQAKPCLHLPVCIKWRLFSRHSIWGWDSLCGIQTMFGTCFEPECSANIETNKKRPGCGIKNWLIEKGNILQFLIYFQHDTRVAQLLERNAQSYRRQRYCECVTMITVLVVFTW